MDGDGQSVEDFGMADNLMTIGALESGAGRISADFDDVVKQIAQSLMAPGGAASLRSDRGSKSRAP